MPAINVPQPEFMDDEEQPKGDDFKYDIEALM